MRRNYRVAVSVLAAGIVLGLSMSAQAKGAQPGPCSSNVNVTSIIADTDSNNNPFQLQSDGKGSYVTYTNSKTDSVVSELQACAWLLDITTSASRAVTLTLLYPASTPSAPPPFTKATPVLSRFISVCGFNPLNDGINYGSMTYAGQTLECALRIGEIPYNGKTYAVAFNPDNYAGSTWLQVTCTGAVSSVCNAWTTTPIPGLDDPYTGQPSAIGELIEVSTAKGKNVDTPLGQYYFAFYVTTHK